MSNYSENSPSGPDTMDLGDRPDDSGPTEGRNQEDESMATDQHEDMQSLMDAQDGGSRQLRRRQIIKGVVVSVSEDVVLVDVGAKSEGVIQRDELAEQGEEVPALTYGQEILVHVLEPDSPQGPVLSLKRARREQSWVDLEGYVQSGQTVTAPVVDHNRGGALLDVRGIRGFIPLSQLVRLAQGGPESDQADDVGQRLEQLRGQMLTVKVLEVDRNQNRLILSERGAADEARGHRRERLMTDLRAGQTRTGTVRNVTNFGAFVDLGGADGLVHVSEISYERVQDPRRVLQPGQKVEVYVLEVRPEDGKISLSMKRAKADPWETFAIRFQPGQVVDATIIRLMKFGAFAQVEPGVEGLIHITELAKEAPKDPGQIVSEGQVVQTKIIHIDEVSRRLGLSIRQVSPVDEEPLMTTEEWNAEQERDIEPGHAGLQALSALADESLEEEPTDLPEVEGAITSELQTTDASGFTSDFQGSLADEIAPSNDEASAQPGTSEGMASGTPELNTEAGQSAALVEEFDAEMARATEDGDDLEGEAELDFGIDAAIERAGLQDEAREVEIAAVTDEMIELEQHLEADEVIETDPELAVAPDVHTEDIEDRSPEFEPSARASESKTQLPEQLRNETPSEEASSNDEPQTPDPVPQSV